MPEKSRRCIVRHLFFQRQLILILFKLLSSPKKTFTRSQLMNDLWDYDSSATSRTVDVTMAKLREKTAECDGFEIVTMRGLGYKAVLK